MTRLPLRRMIQTAAALVLAGAGVATLGVGPAAAQTMILGTVTVTSGPDKPGATAAEVSDYGATNYAWAACKDRYPNRNRIAMVSYSLVSSSPYQYSSTWQCIDDTSAWE